MDALRADFADLDKFSTSLNNFSFSLAASDPIYLQSAQGLFKKVTSADHIRSWVSNASERM